MVGNKERWYIFPGQNGVVFCCCCSLFCFFLACVPQSVEVYGTGYKVLERHGLCLTTKACIKENGYSEEWYLLRGTAWGPDKTCLIMANTVITVLYSKIPTNTGCLAGKDDFFWVYQLYSLPSKRLTIITISFSNQQKEILVSRVCYFSCDCITPGSSS